MKTDIFQSCGHCWVFQISWHIECSTLTTSSFRIWNSSAGIPSPPPALFVVMLPKAHLTSHFRMSGYRCVITPLSLSGSWRSFSYCSSVYSCHLFFISSASVRSFIEPIFAWKVPLISLIFLKRSLVFLILLFSSISFRMHLRDLLSVPGTLNSSSHPQFKSIISLALSFLYSPTLLSIHDYWENHSSY